MEKDGVQEGNGGGSSGLDTWMDSLAGDQAGPIPSVM